MPLFEDPDLGIRQVEQAQARRAWSVRASRTPSAQV